MATGSRKTGSGWSEEDEGSTLLTDELLSTREPASWNPHLSDLEQLKHQVDRLIAENYLLRRQLNLTRQHSSLRVANLVATVLSWLDEGATGLNVTIRRKGEHLQSIPQPSPRADTAFTPVHPPSPPPPSPDYISTIHGDDGPLSVKDFDTLAASSSEKPREMSTGKRMTPEFLRSILNGMSDAHPAANESSPQKVPTMSVRSPTIKVSRAPDVSSLGTKKRPDSSHLQVPTPLRNITLSRGGTEPPPWSELTDPASKDTSKQQQQQPKSISFQDPADLDELSDSDIEASQKLLFASMESDTELENLSGLGPSPAGPGPRPGGPGPHPAGPGPSPPGREKAHGYIWTKPGSSQTPGQKRKGPVATSTPDTDKTNPTKVITPAKKDPKSSSDHDRSRSVTDELRSLAHSKYGGRRILGEIAYQLDRRILNYVFKQKDDDLSRQKKRRLYGYMVQNIPAKIDEECLDRVTGKVDEAKKYVLEYRYKHILYCLGPTGYDLEVHPNFAADVVNKYGLLPIPDKNSSLRSLKLDAYVNLRKLIATMTSQEEERHMNLLLNCLALLAKDDGKPLFIW